MANLPFSPGTRYKRAFSDDDELTLFKFVHGGESVFKVARAANVTPQAVYKCLGRVNEMIRAAIASGEAHASVAGRLGLTVEIVKAAEKRAQARKDNLAKSRTSLTR